MCDLMQAKWPFVLPIMLCVVPCYSICAIDGEVFTYRKVESLVSH